MVDPDLKLREGSGGGGGGSICGSFVLLTPPDFLPSVILVFFYPK